MTLIHPMAFVDPSAEIGPDCQIGPFCYVGPTVRLGARNRLLNHATITGPTAAGDDNVFHPGCVIGGPPQDIGYKGEPTRLAIGDRNTFRECVTVNRGTLKQDLVTILGSDNLLMACSHVGHDAVVEDHCILVNNALLAGHVKIEKCAIIGGGSAMHHFTTVGQYAYIGGMTRIVRDEVRRPSRPRPGRQRDRPEPPRIRRRGHRATERRIQEALPPLPRLHLRPGGHGGRLQRHVPGSALPGTVPAGD